MEPADVFLSSLSQGFQRPGHTLVPPPPLKHLGRPLSPGCRTACDVNAPWEDFYQQPLPRQLSSRSLVPESPVPVTSFLESGTYVTFSIDVEAVAYRFIQDPEAYKRILDFPAKKYAALVSRDAIDGGLGTNDGSDTVTLYMVGNAPPPVTGREAHCLPIGPTTEPGGHALETNMLLPWKDMLQWTAFGTKVWITQVHESCLRFRLQDDSWSRFDAKAEEDGAADAAAQNARCADEDLRIAPVQVWWNVRETEADSLDDPAEFFAELDTLAT